jgi:hypothetical protein
MIPLIRMNVGHCALLLTEETDMLNITQHPASIEQEKAGVCDVLPEWQETLVSLLTFTSLPSQLDVMTRVHMITATVVDMLQELEGSDFATNSVMIGGAPYLMGPLSYELEMNGITPYFAYSERVSSEVDGVKTSIFKHLGFVQAS